MKEELPYPPCFVNGLVAVADKPLSMLTWAFVETSGEFLSPLLSRNPRVAASWGMVSHRGYSPCRTGTSPAARNPGRSPRGGNSPSGGCPGTTRAVLSLSPVHPCAAPGGQVVL